MMLRRTLRRWHVWLGWIVGLPLLLWTLSGLIMVVKPIEEVRGTALIRPSGPVRLAAPPVLPSEVAGLPLVRASLEQHAAGPRWVLEVEKGPTRLADPATGRLLPPLGAAEATAEFRARYTGSATIRSVTRTDPRHPPLELRRPLATWRIELSDGTRVFVAADSGSIVATRTRWWRLYDFMWGLHILDPAGREDTNHPWLIGLAGLSLLTVLLALVLLPLVSRRRRA